MIESLETRRCMSATGGMDAMMTRDVPTETAVELTWSEVNQAVKAAVGAVVKAIGEAVVANAAVSAAVWGAVP